MWLTKVSQMQSFLLAARSLLWGLSLLCVLSLMATSGLFFVFKFTRSHYYRSSQFTEEAVQVRDSIRGDVERLKTIRETQHWDGDLERFIISGAAISEASSLKRSVDDKVSHLCGLCVKSIVIDREIFGSGGDHQYEYAQKMMSQLEYLSDPDRISLRSWCSSSLRGLSRFSCQLSLVSLK
jgi:hypothetical protein